MDLHKFFGRRLSHEAVQNERANALISEQLQQQRETQMERAQIRVESQDFRYWPTISNALRSGPTTNIDTLPIQSAHEVNAYLTRSLLANCNTIKFNVS